MIEKEKQEEQPIRFDLLLELKKKAQNLPAIIHIGKSGLSDAVLREIVKQCNIHHLVKIKLLKNFMDETGMTKKEIGELIASKTASLLIAMVGNTVVVYKSR